MLRNIHGIYGFALLTAVLSGCSTFNPQPQQTDSFQERALSKSSDNVTVSIVVPSAEESAVIFDIDLKKKGIQPIWLEIKNRSGDKLLFLPILIDNDYYAPLEVAYKYRNRWSKTKTREKQDFFTRMQMPHVIPANSVVSGYVYGRIEAGIRYANVTLLRDEQDPIELPFALPIPGIQADYERVDFDRLYTDDELIHIDDPETLREALRNLPRSTVDKKNKSEGDPLNLIIIGATGAMPSFAQRNWDITEEIRWGTIFKTIKAFFTGSKYQFSPVSSLYVFDRGQDAAMQKIRETIHERNHLRLWLTPIVYQGRDVWVGQISRDIGVRFTFKTLVTHKIDPDVDAARLYLAQDLLLTHHLEAIGYVEGVEEASRDTPRHNLTGDPYFTDGLRLVMIFSSDMIHPNDMDILGWAQASSPH